MNNTAWQRARREAAQHYELTLASEGLAQIGFEASSFFVDDDNRPRLGVFLVVDPDALAGIDPYFDRVETLVRTMLADESVGLPGDRRRALAAKAAHDRVEVQDGIVTTLQKLAAA